MDKTEIPKTSAHLVVLKPPQSPYMETKQLRHAAFEPSRNKPSDPSRPILHVDDGGEEEDPPYKRQESGCKSSFVCNSHNVCKELVQVGEGSVMRRPPCGRRFSSPFRLRMVCSASYISVAMTWMFSDSTRLRC